MNAIGMRRISSPYVVPLVFIGARGLKRKGCATADVRQPVEGECRRFDFGGV